MIKEVKVVYYNDGLTVEDEIGNKLFVKENMFKGSPKYRRRRDSIAFAIGEIFLDRMYNSKRVLYIQQAKDENYIK